MKFLNKLLVLYGLILIKTLIVKNLHVFFVKRIGIKHLMSIHDSVDFISR